MYKIIFFKKSLFPFTDKAVIQQEARSVKIMNKKENV